MRRAGAEEVSETHLIVDQDQMTRRDASELLRSLNPDLVIVRKTGRLSNLMSWVSMLQRRKVVGYDQRPYLRPRHFTKILRGALKGRPTHRFTPVHGLTGTPDPWAAYIPFPVEPMPAGTSRTYFRGGTVRILCVAKLAQRRKNQFLLLRALEPLASEVAFHVTFVGSSTLDTRHPDLEHFQALKEYATHGPLAKSMQIQTDVPFAEMPLIYRNHDICVLPSREEPLGTAPLEAMGQGCAAIISSDAGSAYYVKSAELAGLPCGAVFGTDDEAALRNALAGLVQNRLEMARLGQNALRWTRQEFSEEKFVRNWQDFVSKYAKQGKP
jgi:glycosyltransferase involved in cell wall biosynthesis